MKTVRLKAPWITDRWNEELREIVHIESASIALNEAIEEVVYYLLNQNWDGWEINEGSSGQVTFEARDRKVIVEISVRHIETKDHRKEF